LENTSGIQTTSWKRVRWLSKIAREENYFRRRIQEALEILCQSPMLNQYCGFELLALYADILAHDLVYPSSVVTKRFLPHSFEKAFDQ